MQKVRDHYALDEDKVLPEVEEEENEEFSLLED